MVSKLQEAFSFIEFHEEGHRYYSYGKKVISVTGLLKQYQKPFDREFWLPKSAKKHGLTIEEMGRQWDHDRDTGLECGKHLHAFLQNGLERRYIRLVTNNQDVRNRFEKLEPQCKEWIKTQQGRSLASEVVVGNDKLGGQIDNLDINFWLWDYKTDKKINREGFQGQTFLPPFDHLQDCEYIKYSLQTSLYRLLLESQGFICPGATIVWFNQDNPTFELIEPLFLRDECEFLLGNT